MPAAAGNALAGATGAPADGLGVTPTTERSGRSVRSYASGGDCGTCGGSMRARQGRRFCCGACRARAYRGQQTAGLVAALDRVTRAIAAAAVELEAARQVASRPGSRRARGNR
jgi:hypothetical protein